jgi:hypothetical protein
MTDRELFGGSGLLKSQPQSCCSWFILYTFAQMGPAENFFSGGPMGYERLRRVSIL